MFQLILSGLAIGAVYGLVAMGFSLLWQTSQTINFAQGDFLTVSAVLIVILVGSGLPFPLALLLVLGAVALVLGYIYKRSVIQPLIEKDPHSIIVATIALSFLLRNSVSTFWSTQTHRFPITLGEGTYRLGSVSLSKHHLFTVLIAVALIGGLQLFIKKTKTGKAMRAVAQNREAAEILGIDIQLVTTIVFVINGLLVAFASILVAPTYMVSFSMGTTVAHKAFYSAIIGGFNQLHGALLGGFIVGIVESFTAAYVSTQYKELFVLILLIATILIKKQGILGTEEY